MWRVGCWLWGSGSESAVGRAGRWKRQVGNAGWCLGVYKRVLRRKFRNPERGEQQGNGWEHEEARVKVRLEVIVLWKHRNLPNYHICSETIWRRVVAPVDP